MFQNILRKGTLQSRGRWLYLVVSSNKQWCKKGLFIYIFYNVPK